MRLSSEYNRARQYLEDEGPLSIDAFKAQFNDQLFRAKGSDWIREGLLFEGATQERERQVTREEFFTNVREVTAEKKSTKRKSRFRYGFTPMGPPYKYDMKAHRFAKINRADEKRLRSIKPDYRSSRRSQSKVNKKGK